MNKLRIIMPLFCAITMQDNLHIFSHLNLKTTLYGGREEMEAQKS